MPQVRRYPVHLCDDGDQSQAKLPLSHRLAFAMETQDQEREDIRRLYVAATRHMDHLIFIGDWRTQAGQFRSSQSFIAQMDHALGISEALEAQTGRLTYDNGRFGVIVKTVVPQPQPRTQRNSPRPANNRNMPPPPATSPPTSSPLRPRTLAKRPRSCTNPQAGTTLDIAVTALGDFAPCPILYRWPYELGVKSGMAASGMASRPRPKSRPNPVGTPPTPNRSTPPREARSFTAAWNSSISPIPRPQPSSSTRPPPTSASSNMISLPSAKISA